MRLAVWRRMRAAIVRSYGSNPELGDWPEPADGARVLAAALNPSDLRIASGTFYTGAPDLPYVTGGEAIVERDGRRFYAWGAGAFAERMAFEPNRACGVPDGVEPGLALACGVAGTTALAALERARLAEGESVLVLGARGAVGALALQLAPLLGAGRVVGASRSASEAVI